MAAFQSTSASQGGESPVPEVVEISLLLPRSRVNALIELSRKKQQSVGQLLRSLIDQAIRAEEQADRRVDRLDPFGTN
jgi:hypothetical protein